VTGGKIQTMRASVVVLIGLLGFLAGASARQPAIAVFDLELVDASVDGTVNGPRADEQARLMWLSERLRQRLSASDRFFLIDVAPVADSARASNLQACGGCDARLADRIGADLALTGTVYKVSNLILNLSLNIREAKTGRLVAAMNADFRGNTDESWSRALDWLLRNRLLVTDLGGAQ
jgi:hypothetical protein